MSPGAVGDTVSNMHILLACQQEHLQSKAIVCVVVCTGFEDSCCLHLKQPAATTWVTTAPDGMKWCLSVASPLLRLPYPMFHHLNSAAAGSPCHATAFCVGALSPLSLHLSCWAGFAQTVPLLAWLCTSCSFVAQLLQLLYS
jgi:hypothetical protein